MCSHSWRIKREKRKEQEEKDKRKSNREQKKEKEEAAKNKAKERAMKAKLAPTSAKKRQRSTSEANLQWKGPNLLPNDKQLLWNCLCVLLEDHLCVRLNRLSVLLYQPLNKSNINFNKCCVCYRTFEEDQRKCTGSEWLVCLHNVGTWRLCLWHRV